MSEDNITDSRIPLLLLSCSRKHWGLPTAKVRSIVLPVVLGSLGHYFLAHLKFESGRSSPYLREKAERMDFVKQEGLFNSTVSCWTYLKIDRS